MLCQVLHISKNIEMSYFNLVSKKCSPNCVARNYVSVFVKLFIFEASYYICLLKNIFRNHSFSIFFRSQKLFRWMALDIPNKSEEKKIISNKMFMFLVTSILFLQGSHVKCPWVHWWIFMVLVKTLRHTWKGNSFVK